MQALSADKPPETENLSHQKYLRLVKKEPTLEYFWGIVFAIPPNISPVGRCVCLYQYAALETPSK